MKMISFLAILIGIILLTSLYFLLPEKEVFSQSDLTNLEENQKVSLTDLIISEKYISNNIIMRTSKNFTLIRSLDKESYFNRTIKIWGKLDKYENKNQIIINTIEVLN